jgi:steroid delta-isomerase-like uncharacterized protein
MDHAEAGEVVHSWFERVWNQGDLTAIDELFPSEGIAHGLSGEGGRPRQGPARFTEFVRTFRGAVPDIHIDVLRCVTQGSFCAAHCLVTGTHRDGTLGVPATDRATRFEGMTLVRVENGQILEARNFFDFLSFYQQIGALPQLPSQQ